MIKKQRKNMGLTQKVLARKVGISQGYMSKLENPDLYHKNVTIDLIISLSKELKSCPIDLFVHFSKSSRTLCNLNCHFCYKSQNNL